MPDFNSYQKWAQSTCTNEETQKIPYLTLGLVGEAGEVAEKVKKNIRDKTPLDDSFLLELGDVLWYLSNLATFRGYTLEEVADANVNKIESRKARGTQQGSGDYR